MQTARAVKENRLQTLSHSEIRSPCGNNKNSNTMYNVTAAGLATGCEIVNLCDVRPLRDLQDVSPAMGGVSLTHSKNANRTSGKGKQLTHTFT